MNEVARRSVLLGGVAGLVACGPKAPAKSGVEVRSSAAPSGAGEPEVSPAEDLMREHGVLNRILLVYEEVGARLAPGSSGGAAGGDVPAASAAPLDVLGAAARLVRRFVEDYHERLEEQFIFPRFEGAATQVVRGGEVHVPLATLRALVGTLRTQHQAGRRLTDEILQLVGPGAGAPAPAVRDAAARSRLLVVMRAFVRMYRPHEAREDTVLFPALPEVIGPRELDELGDRFEAREHELFGPKGFEGVVEQVAALEEQVGIHDLARFTPSV